MGRKSRKVVRGTVNVGLTLVVQSPTRQLFRTGGVGGLWAYDTCPFPQRSLPRTMIRMARPKAHFLPHPHETPEAGAGPEKAAENVNP